MSKFEKILAAVIAILVLVMVIYSVREIREPHDGGSQPPSRFSQAVGTDFAIGPFNTVTSTRMSDTLETNCEHYQSVIIGALHDVKQRLEHMDAYSGVEESFAVSSDALQVFCHTDATITLADESGNSLILHKLPFTRATPPGGMAEDIGTDVHIDATVVPAGQSVPATPTTFGDVLIPDRYLDTLQQQ